MENEQTETQRKITSAHQIMTIVGIPLILMFVGWIAFTFDKIRLDTELSKRDIAFLKENVAELRQNFNSVFAFTVKRNSNSSLNIGTTPPKDH